jgi:hypothetical protein
MSKQKHSTYLSPWLVVSLLLALFSFKAHAQLDALDLESAPIEKVQEIDSTSSTKLFIEGAIGNASQRYVPGSVDVGRASLDLSFSGRVGPGLRAVLSDRIDVVHPVGLGADSTINSLREAYLSWQPNDVGDLLFDFGRINLRNGPAYGYNPTDFFRDGSLRVLTSADPFALRQNRIGSVMLRGQRLWDGGSLSVAYSPKLATRPGADGWSLDVGSTNNRDRGLVTLATRFSQTVNSQLFLYKEDGLSSAVGANMTALLSDAATAHVEWTRGREPDLLTRAFVVPANTVTRNRFVGGFTYTTLGKTSLTAEYQYNGFALSPSRWSALSASPGAQLGYLREALRLQELSQRQAILIYITQKDLGLKDLDLTAYLRYNTGDNSKLAWVELRRHWPQFDLTFQLQQNIGRQKSEFGILPDRRILQVLGTYYF